MRLACVTIAYREARLIVPFIQHMQDRVEEIVVLNSKSPWFGEVEASDHTAEIARSLGATVFEEDWLTEQDQRNAGQEYCTDYDWVIVLDPDEFVLDEDWDRLYNFLETAPLDAYVCQNQNTYWKQGFIIDPPEDYKQIIAVRPTVRFVDKRVVGSLWGYAPTDLHHMSWRRSDQEVWRKINSYAHALEFDTLKWFSEVWSDPDRLFDLHPLTPPSLARAVRVELPEELRRLGL